MRLTVDIKGKSFPLEYKMGAQRLYRDRYGKELEQIKSSTDMGEFLYCCMICACRRECIKCDLTVDDFLDELDMIQVADMFQKLLAEYVTVDKQPKKKDRP